MNRVLLFLVMLPSGLWARLGADVTQLRAILDARLTLDDRRPMTGLTRPGAQRKKRRFAILLSVIISVFSGAVYTFAFAMNDPRSALFFYFAIFLLMLSFMLISDFSNVLVDTRDKYIVLPAPVSGRTIFLARMLHIGAYLLRIVLPMALPGAIVLGINDGWASGLWFFVPVILLASTALFLVLGVYLLILRLAGRRRFHEILSFFQIGFSVLIFGCYYILPRLIERSNLLNYSIAKFRWAPFTPPYWLMSLYTLVQPYGQRQWLWAAVAVLFPLLCMYLTVRVLAPRFTAILGELDAVEASDGAAPVVAGKRSRTPRLGLRLARLLNRTPEEQAGFMLVWIQSGRSRSFKMRVYPALATVPIMTLAPILLNSRKPNVSLEDVADSGLIILPLYICTFFLIQTLSALSMSEQYKASWIYRASPLAEPGAVIAASYKVMLVRFVFPFITLISAFVIYAAGARAIPDIILAAMNITLFGWCLMRILFLKLPFSQAAEDTGGGSRFLMSMLGLIIGSILAFAHFLTFDYLVLKIVFMILTGIAMWLVSDSVRHTPWPALVSKD